jgi:hypothetical protein
MWQSFVRWIEKLKNPAALCERTSALAGHSTTSVDVNDSVVFVPTPTRHGFDLILVFN